MTFTSYMENNWCLGDKFKANIIAEEKTQILVWILKTRLPWFAFWLPLVSLPLIGRCKECPPPGKKLVTFEL